MAIKQLIKQTLVGVRRLCAHLGVDVLPVNYYSPVPDIRALARTRDVWARKSELPGIHVDLDEQAAALREACLPHQAEYAGNRAYSEGAAQGSGPGYGYIEAQALHGVVRHLKPPRVIEVGSGVSTYCTLHAAKLNEADGAAPLEMTCIEPYPSKWLQQEKRVGLIPRPVQDVPVETFAKLGDGDMLFIDSSHAVKPGSDVNFLFLEVLPRLGPGVIVHVHDINLPFDYPRDVFSGLFPGAEVSLLRAFLTFNDRYCILFCLSHLHYDRPEVLKEVFPEYRPQGGADGLRPQAYKSYAPIDEHFPSSIYLRVTAGPES